jgi:hypothetical protein
MYRDFFNACVGWFTLAFTAESPAREPVGSRHLPSPDSPALSVALFSGTPPFLSEAAIAATHTARAASFRLGMCEVPHTLASGYRTSTNMLAARWGATTVSHS